MIMRIEASEGPLAAQMNQFTSEISNYESLLGLDPDEVIAFKKLNNFVQFAFPWQGTIQAYAHSFTSYKRQLHFGPSEALMGALPVLPVYPAVIPDIPLGNARTQFSNIIQNCMKSPNFTRDIGIILDILEPEVAEKPEEATPVLTVKHTTGGHPILHTVKGNFGGYEVWKDLIDGKGYHKIDTSLYADYIDNSQLPAIGVAQTWKYKIIYSLKAAQCGNWSNEVSIGVIGMI